MVDYNASVGVQRTEKQHSDCVVVDSLTFPWPEPFYLQTYSISLLPIFRASYDADFPPCLDLNNDKLFFFLCCYCWGKNISDQ